MRYFIPYGADFDIMTALCKQLECLGHECTGYVYSGISVPSYFTGIKTAKPLTHRQLLSSSRLEEACTDVAPAMLSLEILERMQPAWQKYCHIADRMPLCQRSFKEHREYYRDVLRYSLGLLQSLAVDFILMPSMPHMTYSVIWHHAAILLGKPSFYLCHCGNYLFLKQDEETFADLIIPDRSFVPESMNNVQRQAWDASAETLQIGKTFSPANTPDILEFAPYKKMETPAEYSTTNFYRALIGSILESHLEPWPKKALHDAKYLLWELYFHLTLSSKRLYASSRLNMPSSRWPRTFAFMKTIENFRNGKRLFRKYRRLTSVSDLKKPYIYLALHYQPESTTMPEAGYFADQFLAAAILAEALPDGWSLYIKEHPGQFRYKFPSLYLDTCSGRTPADYDDLATLRHTVLVSPEIPNAELVENARICATMTGTTGWESLYSGVPAIVFGDAYYAACESCRKVGSVEEAKNAIVTLSSMSSDTVKLHAIQFFVGMTQKALCAFPPGIYTASHNIERNLGSKNISALAVAIDKMAKFRKIHV